jgi:hypothetical protein
MSTHANVWTPGQTYYTLSFRVDTIASTRRKIVIPDKGVKLMLECSDSDLRSSEIDGNHSVDDIAVIDTLVNDDDNDNEAEAANAKSSVREDMSNYDGQREHTE